MDALGNSPQQLELTHPRMSMGSSSLRWRPAPVPGSSDEVVQPAAERLMGCLRSSSSRP